DLHLTTRPPFANDMRSSSDDPIVDLPETLLSGYPAEWPENEHIIEENAAGKLSKWQKEATVVNLAESSLA
ncbi:MAG: hypothetical protein KAJ12_02050, partial [Bacteroidetes bacterium]|nr:hypothetical protein [Bacteroidota bacterium]